MTRNVTIANIRSVSVTPSAVGNGRCSRRRRRSTYSTYGESTVPTRTGIRELASSPMLVAEKASVNRE